MACLVPLTKNLALPKKKIMDQKREPQQAATRRAVDPFRKTSPAATRQPLPQPIHRPQQRTRQTLEPTQRRTLKVPEALPTEQRVKESPFQKFTSAVFRKKTAIQEIVREPTSGGIVFRLTKDKKDIEILLIQDSKGRWTIPKGHIEPGETAKMTARREIEEETGLKNFDVLVWLGKIHFKYRRTDKLVLMTTQIYLVQALDAREMPTGEKWMRGIRWFPFAEALDLIEYEDIEKLMLIAKKRIRAGDF